jgi:hypothetical protein
MGITALTGSNMSANRLLSALLRPLTALLLSLLLLWLMWLGQAGLRSSHSIFHKDYVYNSLTQDCKNSTGSELFRVYALGDKNAEKLAESLCAQTAIRQHFSKVEVQWGRINALRTNALKKKRYHLWAMPQGTFESCQNRENDSQKMAEYQPYTACLIAREGEPTPEINDEYFKNKTLGLRSKETGSASGYTIPRAFLKEAGVDISQVSQVAKKTHKDLEHALMSGEVDVIGSYCRSPEENIGQELIIEKGLPGYAWHVRAAVAQNNAQRCAVSNALKNLTDAAQNDTQRYAASSGNNYFSHLKMSNSCQRNTP